MKYLSFLIAIFLSANCQNVSSKSENIFAEQTRKNSSVKNEDDEASAIHKIDFQNFTYPWTKSFGGKRKPFTLNNGISKTAEDERLSLQSLSFTSNEDKAFVVINIDDGNAAYQMLYIYELENNKLNLLESFEFGKDNIYFRTAFEAHGELVIETSRQLSGDAECCPSVIEISYYKWQKDKYVLQGEPQKVASEYVERIKKRNEKNRTASRTRIGLGLSATAAI